MIHKITSSYLHQLQWKFHQIDNRGICMDVGEMKTARRFIDEEIARNLKIASDQWQCSVFIGADNAPTNSAAKAASR